MLHSIFFTAWEECKEGLSLKEDQEDMAKTVFLAGFVSCNKFFSDVATGVINPEIGLKLMTQLQTELTLLINEIVDRKLDYLNEQFFRGAKVPPNKM